MSQSPNRIKNTFAAPQVCIGCFWEDRVKNQTSVNKQLRGELLKFTAAKRSGRKAEPAAEREEDRDGPADVLDEMSGMGKFRLDD